MRVSIETFFHQRCRNIEVGKRGDNKETFADPFSILFCYILAAVWYLPRVSKIAYVCFFGGEDFKTSGQSDLKVNIDPQNKKARSIARLAHAPYYTYDYSPYCRIQYYIYSPIYKKGDQRVQTMRSSPTQ